MDTNIPDPAGGFLTGTPSDTSVGLGQAVEPSVPVMDMHSTGSTDSGSGIPGGGGVTRPLDTSLTNAHSDTGSTGLLGFIPLPVNPISAIPIIANQAGAMPSPASPAGHIPAPANVEGVNPAPVSPFANTGGVTSGFLGLLQGLGAGEPPIAQAAAPATGLLRPLLRREARNTREGRVSHRSKGPRRVDSWEDHEKRQDTAGNVLSTLTGAAASLPQVPAAPQLPSTPQVPAIPQVPSAPQVPSVPQVPDAPAAPVADIEALPGNATTSRS